MCTKFVIASIMRSRTNVFIEHLNNHPQILCHYEVFHPEHVFVHQNYLNRLGLSGFDDIHVRDKDDLNFLNKLFTTHDNGIKAIGFKFFPDHVFSCRDNLLRDDSVKKIIMKRNLLLCYTSFLIASKTGQWYCRKWDARETSKVTLSVESFINYCDSITEFYDEIESALVKTGQDWLSVNSTEVMNPRFYDSIIEFLEIDNYDFLAEYELRSQNPKLIRDRILNYDQFSKDIANTPYAHYLEEE